MRRSTVPDKDVEIVRPFWLSHVEKRKDLGKMQRAEAKRIQRGIFSVDIQPNGTRFATGGGDAFANIWNLGSLLWQEVDQCPILDRQLARLKHKETVHCVRFSNCGNILATASGSAIAFFEYKGERIPDAVIDSDEKSSVAVMANGASTVNAAFQSEENTDREVWEKQTTLKSENDDIINDFGWSIDDQFVASAGTYNKVLVWQREPSRQLGFTKATELLGHTGFILGVSFDPLNKYLVSVSGDGTVRVWATADWSCVRVVDGFANFSNLEVSETTFARGNWTPDGCFFAAPSGFEHNSLFVCSVLERNSWRAKYKFVGHSETVTVSKFSPRLYCYDSELAILGKTAAKRRAHVNHLNDGDVFTLCVAASMSCICLYASHRDEPIAVFKNPFGQNVMDAVWNQSGNALVIVSHSGSSLLFKFTTQAIGGLPLSDEQQLDYIQRKCATELPKALRLQYEKRISCFKHRCLKWRDELSKAMAHVEEYVDESDDLKSSDFDSDSERKADASDGGVEIASESSAVRVDADVHMALKTKAAETCFETAIPGTEETKAPDSATEIAASNTVTAVETVDISSKSITPVRVVSDHQTGENTTDTEKQAEVGAEDKGFAKVDAVVGMDAVVRMDADVEEEEEEEVVSVSVGAVMTEEQISAVVDDYMNALNAQPPTAIPATALELPMKWAHVKGDTTTGAHSADISMLGSSVIAGVSGGVLLKSVSSPSKAVATLHDYMPRATESPTAKAKGNLATTALRGMSPSKNWELGSAAFTAFTSVSSEADSKKGKSKEKEKRKKKKKKKRKRGEMEALDDDSGDKEMTPRTRMAVVRKAARSLCQIRKPLAQRQSFERSEAFVIGSDGDLRAVVGRMTPDCTVVTKVQCQCRDRGSTAPRDFYSRVTRELERGSAAADDLSSALLDASSSLSSSFVKTVFCVEIPDTATSFDCNQSLVVVGTRSGEVYWLTSSGSHLMPPMALEQEIVQIYVTPTLAESTATSGGRHRRQLQSCLASLGLCGDGDSDMSRGGMAALNGATNAHSSSSIESAAIYSSVFPLIGRISTDSRTVLAGRSVAIGDDNELADVVSATFVAVLTNNGRLRVWQCPAVACDCSELRLVCDSDLSHLVWRNPLGASFEYLYVTGWGQPYAVFDKNVSYYYCASVGTWLRATGNSYWNSYLRDASGRMDSFVGDSPEKRASAAKQRKDGKKQPLSCAQLLERDTGDELQLSLMDKMKMGKEPEMLALHTLSHLELQLFIALSMNSFSAFAECAQNFIKVVCDPGIQVVGDTVMIESSFVRVKVIDFLLRLLDSVVNVRKVSKRRQLGSVCAIGSAADRRALLRKLLTQLATVQCIAEVALAIKRLLDSQRSDASVPFQS